MAAAKVSPVWVGYADFLNILFITFVALFLIMFAQKADEDISQKQITDELVRVLKPKLAQWDASIDVDGTVTFDKPELLFTTGSAQVSPRFKEILIEFAPVYMSVMTDKRFKKRIGEIRIEGHTSRIWNGQVDAAGAYLNNARLSQARASAAMEFLFTQKAIADEFDWISTVWTANGLSSSRPRTGVSDPNSTAHQRVEFRFEIKRLDKKEVQPKNQKIEWKVL